MQILLRQETQHNPDNVNDRIHSVIHYDAKIITFSASKARRGYLGYRLANPDISWLIVLAERQIRFQAAKTYQHTQRVMLLGVWSSHSLH